MNYRRRIDLLRKEQNIVKFNLVQVKYDMTEALKSKDYSQYYENLLAEYYQCVADIKKYDTMIDALQPWYRKAIGVLY